MNNIFYFRHVDYIFNGGTLQKGCFYPTCSHSRAHFYFNYQYRANKIVGRCFTGKIKIIVTKIHIL